MGGKTVVLFKSVLFLATNDPLPISFVDQVMWLWRGDQYNYPRSGSPLLSDSSYSYFVYTGYNRVFKLFECVQLFK
jgi:hypothetical protein